MPHTQAERRSAGALARIGLALTCLFTSADCVRSPTGRREFIIVSEEKMDQLGSQAFTQLRQQEPVSSNAATNAYVNCVARAVLGALDRSDMEWDVVVFDDPKTVNAFALPGGKIGVYSGLLQVANTPGQLATVIGHEVAHVIARHGAERVSQQLAIDLGVTAVASLMDSDATRALTMGALGVGSQVGVVLPFSRLQESEADEVGQLLMAKAGFDPRESLTLWKRMGQLGGGGPPAFLSEHPSNEDRLEELREDLPEALAAYQQARASRRIPNCKPR